jgi:hypothetical protein
MQGPGFPLGPSPEYRMCEQRGYTIQSVARAIAILNSFNLERPERGVSESSRSQEIHLGHTSDVQEALDAALTGYGAASVGVMPYGGLVLPTLPAHRGTS